MSNKNTEFVNTMVKAGAGAGKTYGLINKIVDLVREFSLTHPEKLPRFVVTTFTRKATQEVRERLLAKALDLQKTDPEFGEVFLKFLKGSGFLFVSTIHGVLNVFLKQYGPLIGLDPDFKLTATSDTLFSQTIHEMLVEDEKFSGLVNKFSFRRVKLFLMEHHRASLFNPQLQPLPEEVFLKYWKTQVQTILTSSQDLMAYIEPQLEKSKGEALKNFYGALSNLKNKILAENDLWKQLQLIRLSKSEFPKSLGSLTQWDDFYKSLRKNLMEIISSFEDDPWIDKEHFYSHLNDQSLLSDFGRQFSQKWLKAKIQLAEIELEDLELLTLYILRQFPNETKVFSESWNYWFIDEYQDTSPIQVEILNALIGDCPHYVVGDPQQSIYFFRGARSKVFFEKLKQFTEASARIEEKKINRRSQTPTLHFINDLMDLVNKHQFTPMDPFVDRDIDELLVGHFYLLSTDQDEEILQQLTFGIKNVLASGAEPSSIAILCRENRELQRVFKQLQLAGLPAQIFSQGDFLEDRAVRDALCFWLFLVNPYNDLNLVELLRSSWFRVSDEILLQASQAKKDSLWKSLLEFNCGTIERVKLYIKDLATLGHYDVWLKGLMDSNAFDDCTVDDVSGRKEGNLWKLVTMIHAGLKDGTLNYTNPLNRELNSEARSNNEARSIRESNQIQLMTIHGSKGLEFEHVFLPFLNQSKKKDGASFFSADLNNTYWILSLIDPQTQSATTSFYAQKTADEVHSLLLEEAERLFYVAITRAKKSLHFFCPEQSDQVSDTGWALHLKEFASKAPGKYLEKSNRYEFQVLKELEDRELTNKNDLAFDVHEVQIPEPQNDPDEHTKSEICSLLTTTHSITEIISQVKNPSAHLDSNTDKSKVDKVFELELLNQGIATHRELESFCATKNFDSLSQTLQTFIKSASFPLLEIIQNGCAEWAFSVESPIGFIEGQIDLWGWDNKKQLWIVDYKTGSSEYKEKAFFQMMFYAWGLLKTKMALDAGKINLAVCYPLQQKTFIKEISIEEIEKTINDSLSSLKN